MGVILNYDLDSKHTPVKDAMKENGYQDYFEYHKTVDGKKVKKKIDLPNTTLYHNSKSPSTAREDLKSTAKSKGAKVLYVLATKFDPDTTGWASYNL